MGMTCLSSLAAFAQFIQVMATERHGKILFEDPSKKKKGSKIKKYGFFCTDQIEQDVTKLFRVL